jgi:hypothetical protein
MASIEDLCWTNAEDLFGDLDLDDLYVRQVDVFGAASDQSYPYFLVVYTGKITIGINLGLCTGSVGPDGCFHAGLSGSVDAFRFASRLPRSESSE